MRMARTGCLLAAFLLTAALAAPPDPQTIVRAEKSFADRVRALGVRAGFLDWLAPRASCSAPAGARACDLREPADRVARAPRVASRARGDQQRRLAGLEHRPVDVGGATARRSRPTRSADYMSVWRKQPDGSYRVALDCGIGHPDPLKEETEITYSAPVSTPGLGSRPLAARQSLYQADASFARYAATEGVAGAMSRYATDDIVVLREGQTRIVGRSAAKTALAPFEREPRLTSNAQYISDSGDLGYTYGSYVTGRGTGADSSWYVHVWHRGAAATWRLACDVLMPVHKK